MYGLSQKPRPQVVRDRQGRNRAVIPGMFTEGFDQPDYDAPPESQRTLPIFDERGTLVGSQRYDPNFGRGEPRPGRGLSSRGQNLRSLCENYGPAWTAKRLGQCLATGELRDVDFSLKELAEAFCGHEWVRTLDPRRLGGFQRQRSLLEAGDGVDIAAFQDISGQIFFNRIKDGWKNATLVGESLTDKFPTNLDGERVPWLGHIFDEGESIHPGTEYPSTSFGERYVDTPPTMKWGMQCWVTKEMIFFDRTGQALKAAGEVGWRLGYNKEKRILTVALGQVNSYKLNGTAYNTYLQAPQSVPAYVNAQSSTPLVDYTSVQTALTLASQILDPDTRNPLDGIEFKDLFVMPANLFHARRLVAATEYWNTQPGFAASTTSPEGNIQMHSINPVGSLNIITSPIAYQLFTNKTIYNPNWTALTSTQTNAYWWIGQFKKSFWYMENWPFTVVQAPPNNMREFDQDLVVGWKVSERGVPAVQDPRYTFQFWNT